MESKYPAVADRRYKIKRIMKKIPLYIQYGVKKPEPDPWREIAMEAAARQANPRERLSDLTARTFPRSLNIIYDNQKVEIIMGKFGKIAQLPQGIREELNSRLRADDTSGREILEWLNGLPEVQRVCAERFGGREVNDSNLSLWRDYGYREWLVRQEFAVVVRTLVEGSKELLELVKESPDAMGDMLAAAMASRYADLLTFGGDPNDENYTRRLQDMRMICADVVQLRRGDHALARLSLARQKAEAMQKGSLSTEGGRRSESLR